MNMKAFSNFVNIFIISFLFSFITTTPTYEEYSSVFLNKIRIGSQSKEISLIVDTLSSKTQLFTNSKRPYSTEIEKGRKSDVFIDKVSFAGEVIKSFPFNLCIDDTKLNDRTIQGELGLGIDHDNSNDLIDVLYDNQIISSKVIEVDFEEGDNYNSVVINLSPKIDQFTYCDLTKRRNLYSDDLYYDAWICELSHMVIGSTKKDLTWNNTIEVKGEVAFDSRTKYIYIPKYYIKYITNLWKLDPKECKLIHALGSDEKFYSCSLKMKDKIFDMKSIYFVIGGYGFRLKAPDLFVNDGKNLKCVIRFFNDERDNMWILGVPFLREYKTIFDYKNARIGFKGGDILDFKKDYEKWTKEAKEESKFFKGYTWEKIVMIIGTIVGTLIILYVMFWLYRNCKRLQPKYHIELNENYDKKEFYH